MGGVFFCERKVITYSACSSLGCELEGMLGNDESPLAVSFCYLGQFARIGPTYRHCD